MNPRQPSSRNGNWLFGSLSSTVNVVALSAVVDAIVDACRMHCDAVAGSA